MLRASIAGGLWAFLLSTSGLSFASVSYEIPERSATTLALYEVAPETITTPPVAPQATLAAVAPLPEVTNVAPVIVETSAPVVQVAPELPAAAPAVMATYVPAAPFTFDTTSPGWTAEADIPKTFALLTPAALGQPMLPSAPAVLTEPAIAPPAAVRRIAARPVQSFGNLVVRVQADGNQSRLPQIQAPEPEPELTEEAAIEEVAPEAEIVEEVPVEAPDPGIQIGMGNNNLLDQPVADPTEEAEPEATAEVVTEAVAPEDLPAMQRFAAPFANPDDLPVIGILLIDEGVMSDGPSQIFAAGFPATIAIDALRDDAGLWAEAYREAGMEIAMQVPLPQGVQPTDVEVAYAAAFGILPEAALMYSSGEGVLRNDRNAAAQVISILNAQERGFVTQERGLGSLVRAAESFGVPVVQVWRDLDGEGEGANTMTRSLDRAAFTARQSGDVVVVGRLTPLTLEVLTVWALNAEREGVAFGPVTAVLAPDMQVPAAVAEEAAPEAEQSDAPEAASPAPGQPAPVEPEVTAPEAPAAPETPRIQLEQEGQSDR